MMRFVFPCIFVFGLALPTTAAETAPLTDLLQAKAAATKTADARSQGQEKLQRDTITRREGVTRAATKVATHPTSKSAMTELVKAKAAYDTAVQHEQAGMFADLQAEAARRRTTQALMDAVESYMAEGDAMERAATRAMRGELAPSATDTLSCEQDLCRTIPAQEHAALAQIGAVADTFDTAAWKGAERTVEISVLPRLGDTSPLLRRLRHDLAEAQHAQQQHTADLSKARQALDAALKPWEDAIQNTVDTQALSAIENMTAQNADVDLVIKAHAQAATAKDQADQAEETARTVLREAIATVADQARALKWAASLAESGYMLKADKPTQACAGKTCRAAAGWEAAAFIVLGAVDGEVDLSRRAFAPLATLVSKSGDRYVFAAPRPAI